MDYTKKRDEISTNRSEMENNGLQVGVDIDVMLPVYTLNKYDNIEYNNEQHNILMNCNISTSTNLSFSTLNSPSVTSINDKGCSLFSPIHKNIKYSYFSKKKQEMLGLQVM